MFAIMIVPIVFFILAFLYILYMRNELDKMPLEKATAVVISKRISRLHDDKRYYITFEFNGEIKEFKVYRSLYHNFNEGDIGILSYKKNFFINFESIN